MHADQQDGRNRAGQDRGLHAQGKAPRRFAVLPHNYDTLGQIGASFAIATGLAQLPFFWNVVQTVRGKVAEPRTRDVPLAVAEASIMLLALGLGAVGGVVGWVIGHSGSHGRTHTVTVTTSSGTKPGTTTSPATGGGNVVAGKQVFLTAGCSGCHTLQAAGASGTVGPNLDQAKPPLSLVVDRLEHGKGAMPSFAHTLTAQQIKDVAAFVVTSTGG